MTLSKTLSLGSLALATLLGCRASDTESSSSASPSSFAAQVERGLEVYTESCARCHGNAGQGTAKAPPLVGPTALPLEPRPDQQRAASFHTALDVALFATQNMPPKRSAREALSEADYWAVLAFDLSANGVSLDEPLGPANAASIVLHP